MGRPGDVMPSAELAVIIPTRNAARTLPRCLESLRREHDLPFTTVIIDGGSTDGTLDIALASGPGTVVLPGTYGRSAARRVGVAAVDSPNVLFLDSDQVVSPGLLVEAVAELSTGQTDALVVPEHVRGVGIWTRCAELDQQLFDTEELRYPRFYRRAFYNLIGGHASGLEDYMEDRDLALRARAVSARIGTTTRSISNLADRLNPLTIGRRGALAARDSRVYYRRNRARGERLGSVISPRFRGFVEHVSILRQDPAAAFALPPYLLVAHGPRLLTVLFGR